MFKKPISASIRLLGPQKSILVSPVVRFFTFSGGIPLITQTASITSLIACGGFFIDFTKVISAGFKVSRAASASSKIGMTRARSASQSSFNSVATFALAFAIFSSFFTVADIFCTSFVSFSIISRIAFESRAAITNCGFKIFNSVFIWATCWAANSKRSKPPIYRILASMISVCFILVRLVNARINSKNADVVIYVLRLVSLKKHCETSRADM